MKNLKVLWLAPALIVVVLVTGCSHRDNQSNGHLLDLPEAPNFLVDSQSELLEERLAQQSEIKKFNSWDDLKTFLESNQAVYGSEYASFGMGAMMEESISMDMVRTDKAEVAMPMNAGGESDGALDYSATNVQVLGVDEADIIKTDGDYIYALSEQELFIVKAYPAEEAEVKSIIKFESRPTNIFIKDNKLVVLGTDYEVFAEKFAADFVRRGPYSFIKVFDVSKIDDPKLEKEWKLEGSYSESRLVGDYLYFIANTYSPYIDGEPLLPRVIEDGEVLNFDCAKSDCIIPDIYYFPMPYPSYNFTNVFSLDLLDLEDSLTMDTYLLSSNQNIYVSSDNLYITYTKYLDNYEIESQVIRSLVYPYLDLEDKRKIVSIEEAETFILNAREKQSKIRIIIEKYLASLSQAEQKRWQNNLDQALRDKYTELADQLEVTVIHKIGLDETELTPIAQAEVPGKVLNQFSLDEHDGYLRLATTKNNNRPWYFEEETESDSRVYILDDNLEITGSLTNLAPGERIYSARFMGNRLYLVTFKQIDPLFAIDLSDPRKPTVLGSLKIPGFSNYIHPYDENTLIGFGKDTYVDENERVRVKGLKLSLFDVSDPVNPRNLDNYVVGDSGSYSEVLNDHKALLFSKEKDLLVLPVSLRSPGYGDWTDSFNGALVFSLKDKKFNLRGEISHNQSGTGWQDFYSNQVKRSLYIEDNLYTFSYNYININNLDNLDEVKSLPLGGITSDYQVITPQVITPMEDMEVELIVR